MRIKRLIRILIRKLGVDLIKFDKYSNAENLVLTTLNKFNIDLIIDIGANTGQFANNIRAIGFKKRIISFEPLTKEHSDLSKRASSDNEWIVAPKMAIGEYDGIVEINIAANSGSSSILNMTTSHLNAAPESKYINKENVEIKKLDTIAPLYFDGFKNPLLKIDAQGYESKILDGAEEVISKFKGLICELSLTSLYDGSESWVVMTERIEKLGFTLWSIEPGFTDPHTGRMLQVDATFFRLN